MNHHKDLADIQQQLERMAAKLGNVAINMAVPPFEKWINDCVFQHMGQGSTELHEQHSRAITLWINRFGFTEAIWSKLETMGFGSVQAQNLVAAIQSQVGVCSYCRNLYHIPSGNEIHQLSDAEYRQAESESDNPTFSCGVCGTCHREIMS